MIMRLGYDAGMKKVFTELDGVVEYYQFPETAMLKITKFLMEEINGKLNPNSGNTTRTAPSNELPKCP